MTVSVCSTAGYGVLHKSPESCRTATEEGAAYGRAVPAALARIGHAGCQFNFTAPPSEAGDATAHKACWREREIGRLKNSAVSEIEFAAAYVVASRDQMNTEKVPCGFI